MGKIVFEIPSDCGDECKIVNERIVPHMVHAFCKRLFHGSKTQVLGDIIVSPKYNRIKLEVTVTAG